MSRSGSRRSSPSDRCAPSTPTGDRLRLRRCSASGSRCLSSASGPSRWCVRVPGGARTIVPGPSADSTVEHHPRRRSRGDAGGGRGRRPLRPRTGSGSHRGAGALGVVRHRHGGRLTGRHPHFRERPEHAGVDVPRSTAGTGPTRSTRATTSHLRALTLLNHDPDVAAWTGVDYNNFEIDGESVPVLFGRPGAAVAPPILSGHGLDANNQIVIGSATLAVLHKHVGDTVELSYETPADAPIYLPPTRLADRGDRHVPRGRVRELRRRSHLDGHRGPVLRRGLPAAFLRAVGTNGPEPEWPGAGLRPASERAQRRGGPGQPATDRRRGEQDLRRATPVPSTTASPSLACSVPRRS